MENFKKNLNEIEDGSYNKELIEDNEEKPDLVEKLKEISNEKLFKSKDIVSLELTGHSVLTGLLDYYIKFVFTSNKSYKKRAERLISGSVIRAACNESTVKTFEDLSDYYKLAIAP